jgi:RNA polymerase sigma factor (sigma-70 family)
MRTKSDVNNVVVPYLPMVRSIAWSIARRFPRSCPVDDLVGEGLLALVECTRRFDPDLGTTFGAFARPRAQGAMWDYVRHQCGWLSRQQPFTEDLVSCSDIEATDHYMVNHDLARHLARLPRRQRMVLEEHLQDDNMDSLAEHFGVARRTILRWKQSAISSLQSQMSAA